MITRGGFNFQVSFLSFNLSSMNIDEDGSILVDFNCGNFAVFGCCVSSRALEALQLDKGRPDIGRVQGNVTLFIISCLTSWRYCQLVTVTPR